MRRDELQHTGHAADVERGAASMVTRSGVGTTSVTLSDRGTEDSKVEDMVANTMDVNPCISLIRPQSTRAAARGLRGEPQIFPNHHRCRERVRGASQV
jgi:hypothetical protein